MIWEIGQDAFGTNSEFSLLSAIDYVVKTGSLPITGIGNNLIADSKKIDIGVFPNPFQDEITISTHDEIGGLKVRLTDLHGRELKSQELYLSNREKTIDLSGVPSGIYIIQLEYGGIYQMLKLLKN